MVLRIGEFTGFMEESSAHDQIRAVGGESMLSEVLREVKRML